MSRMDEILESKVDRTKFRVFDSFEESKRSEREYWRSCTPEERLTALEMLRKTTFGYAENERGLRGFFEVVDRSKR
ncbi:MAG: hypothetical protein ACT4O9_12335 [Blastocatellia bacterium]